MYNKMVRQDTKHLFSSGCYCNICPPNCTTTNLYTKKLPVTLNEAKYLKPRAKIWGLKVDANKALSLDDAEHSIAKCIYTNCIQQHIQQRAVLVFTENNV